MIRRERRIPKLKGKYPFFTTRNLNEAPTSFVSYFDLQQTPTTSRPIRFEKHITMNLGKPWYSGIRITNISLKSSVYEFQFDIEGTGVITPNDPNYLTSHDYSGVVRLTYRYYINKITCKKPEPNSPTYRWPDYIFTGVPFTDMGSYMTFDDNFDGDDEINASIFYLSNGEPVITSLYNLESEERIYETEYITVDVNTSDFRAYNPVEGQWTISYDSWYNLISRYYYDDSMPASVKKPALLKPEFTSYLVTTGGLESITDTDVRQIFIDAGVNSIMTDDNFLHYNIDLYYTT